MQQPSVSVIIPTYNREAYLLTALQSVWEQTCPPAEVIVVDDGSTDATARRLAPHRERLRYLHQANRGIGAARNAGVAVASGEFLAFLDDDDIWLPDKLERQLAAFRETPALDAVYGYGEQFVSSELDAKVQQRLARRAGAVLPAALASTLLIRRSAFERVGAFDESLRIGIEMEWYARLGESGIVMRMLDAVVYRRRLHPNNTNLIHSAEQGERLRVLKQVIDRRRRAKAAE